MEIQSFVRDVQGIDQLFEELTPEKIEHPERMGLSNNWTFTVKGYEGTIEYNTVMVKLEQLARIEFSRLTSEKLGEKLGQLGDRLLDNIDQVEVREGKRGTSIHDSWSRLKSIEKNYLSEPRVLPEILSLKTLDEDRLKAMIIPEESELNREIKEELKSRTEKTINFLINNLDSDTYPNQIQILQEMRSNLNNPDYYSLLPYKDRIILALVSVERGELRRLKNISGNMLLLKNIFEGYRYKSMEKCVSMLLEFGEMEKIEMAIQIMDGLYTPLGYSHAWKETYAMILAKLVELGDVDRIFQQNLYRDQIRILLLTIETLRKLENREAAKVVIQKIIEEILERNPNNTVRLALDLIRLSISLEDGETVRTLVQRIPEEMWDTALFNSLIKSDDFDLVFEVAKKLHRPKDSFQHDKFYQIRALVSLARECFNRGNIENAHKAASAMKGVDTLRNELISCIEGQKLWDSFDPYDSDD